MLISYSALFNEAATKESLLTMSSLRCAFVDGYLVGLNGVLAGMSYLTLDSLMVFSA